MKFLCNNARRQSGNILLITVMFMMLIVFACVFGMSLCLLCDEQRAANSKIDAVALNIAAKINEGDRIGQMNNLIEMNRELCFDSRQVSRATSDDLSFLQPLADKLMLEAQLSNQDVEKARLQQIKLMEEICQNETERYNVTVRSAPRIKLPFWQSYEPIVQRVCVGNAKCSLSSVYHNNVWSALNEYDFNKNFVELKSNVYRSNSDAKLPCPDDNLCFNFSALSAPVGQTISPSRLMNAESIEAPQLAYSCDKDKVAPIMELPSAVEIIASMHILTPQSKIDSLAIRSAADCSGASSYLANE